MARIDIVLNESAGTINPNLYGHFAEHLGSCVYEGIWSNGRICAEVVGAMKQIKAPVIRWPGGCFADDYHWRDGIGPNRPRRVNLHWGNVIEDNSFGTHEFLHFCRAVGAQPYLGGNVGSGSPAEMRNWMEYCNFPTGSSLSDERARNGDPFPFNVQFWGVGNEAWGCGGQMTPEAYADAYRRFSTYLTRQGDSPPFLIACGPDGNDLDWSRRLLHHLFKNYRAPARLHGFAAHYYCGTAGNGSATDFTDGEWYELLWKALRMEDLITQQRALLDEFDPQRKIALLVDEWGTWHFPTPGRNPAFLWQQNTLRDALVAALTLDIFNRHCDKVVMANIAQAVNVLQAPLLVENGQVVRTPTFHIFDLYQNHHGARQIRVEFDSPPILLTANGELKKMPGLSGSASIKGQTLTLTIVNPRIAEDVETTIRFKEGGATLVRETLLTHSDIQAHNTFDNPQNLQLSEPRVISASGREFTCTFKPQSVTRLEMSVV
jgi:alpha-N-arabinofuranosidase